MQMVLQRPDRTEGRDSPRRMVLGDEANGEGRLEAREVHERNADAKVAISATLGDRQ